MWIVFEGHHHCKVSNSPWSHGWYSLMSSTSWSWAAQWAVLQTSVRTEHIYELPMSGTIDWKSQFAQREQRNGMEPLLMWVDTFTAQTQMSPRRKGLCPWLKGTQQLSRAAEHQRAPGTGKRVHTPWSYINCGSLLIDCKEPHVLSLSLALLEGHVWDTHDGHQHQHKNQWQLCPRYVFLLEMMDIRR